MGAEVIPPPGNEPSDILSEDKEALADDLADYTDDMPDSYYLLCDASAKAYTLKKELEGQPVAPETQAAREALEVSLELIMHKARAEFERRKRAYAELLEDEQELEAARVLEEQARAADAQELHKKELELKRLRAVDNKEKRRLLKERKELEAEFADTNRLQEKQDADIEAKLSKEYNEMKREHETKMDAWRKQQKLKIKELTKELRLQLEAANVDLHRELEEFVSKDSQLKAVEGEAGAAFYKAQSEYDRVLAEFKAVEASTSEARAHMLELKKTLLEELDADRAAHQLANEEFAARSKALEAEEKDYQSQLEEMDRSAQSEYESSLAELESLAASAEEEIKEQQKAEEAAADASLGGIIRAEELSAKRKKLEEDSTALVEERRRVMEAEAGMTDEEMADSRRIKEKEAVIVGRIEGAKWALERAVQEKHDAVEAQRQSDLAELDAKRTALEAMLETRANLQAAQEQSVEDERAAAAATEEALVQLGIATEHGLADHDQAITDAENDLQRRTEEQAIVSRIAHDKFTAAKAKVDETAMELKRAQEEHRMERERMVQAAKDRRAADAQAIVDREQAREDRRLEIEEELRKEEAEAHEWGRSEQARIAAEKGELAQAEARLGDQEMGSKDEMDAAMAISVEVDEALRAEERHLKSEQFAKESMLRTELKKLDEEERRMGVEMGDKTAAVESSITTQETALGEEIASLYSLLAERKDALNQVVATVEEERSAQRATLEKMRNKATAALANLNAAAPKWREELAQLQEEAKDPSLTKIVASTMRMRIVALQLKLLPLEAETFSRPIAALEGRLQAEDAARQSEIDAERLFLVTEERRVRELIETRTRALEEATRLERRRLDHEGTAWKALLTRRKAAVNLRLERLGEDCEAQWAMLAHLRKQVDSTVEYQQGEEQSRNMKRHALEKENVKWGRKLEIAERTLPENIKTRLKLCAEARLEKLKELDLRAVKDEAQIGIDKANYNKFVVEQEEEQNRQDLREEELGIAVQEAAKSVTEMHNIHRLQRAEWDNQRLPALVEKVRECKAAKSSHITECAQRDIELREEIVFRYEQLEVSKKEAAEAGVERRRADQEDQVAHATVELQFKQAHDARLQVLAGEEVALREAHALDVAAMNRELDEFRVQVAFEARERAERTNAIREAMLAKQKELDELRLYITQTSSAVEADHVRHAQLIGKIAAEMQQLRANAAADYAARKQLITKKKVLGHEALQHRKVERIEEVRRLREQILADLERANHAHDAAQARCDSLKQRLNAAKQELEEHEHTFDQKKQRLDAASAELESHRIKIGEFLPVQRRRVENVHAREKARLEKEIRELEEEASDENATLEGEMAKKAAELEKKAQAKLQESREAMYAKLEGRRRKVAKELKEREDQLASELAELEAAETERAAESAALEAALEARVEARRVEARAKGEARRAERAKAKAAHVEEKRHFNVEMEVLAEQMELELEEFEKEETRFEEAIKARRMREIQEETARMQELMETERVRMQEALRTAQLLAQAKTEAENRAREKAQKRLEHEQQRLKHRMELEAQAERARMQAEMSRMEAERLTLLAAHDSDSDSDSDDDFSSMHIELAAITAAAAAARADGTAAAGTSGAAPGGGERRPGSRGSARGLRATVEEVRGTGEEDLEELKERELRQFEDEKRRIMQEMARMEAEAELLADVEDDELNPPPPPPGTGGT